MHVLITTPLVRPGEAAPLQRLGATVRFAPYRGPRPPGELEGLLAGADAMIASSDALTAEVLARAPRLKLIARAGVGYDAIDMQAAAERGIAVTVTPGANEHAVADFTLAAMLALLRRVVENDAGVRAGGWSRAVGRDLAGKTVGIVGLGRIGKLVARRLAGFDTHLLAYDPYPDLDFAARHGVQFLALDELLVASDVVTLHVLLTPGTRHLLDARRLALLRPTAYVVNTCRGPVIDEAALAAALRAGRLAGAALDVFEEEPPRGSSILEAPNVLLTPHVAGISVESSARMAAMAVEKVARLLGGEPPLHAVEPFAR